MTVQQEPTSEQPSEHVPAPDTLQDRSGDGGVSPRAIRWMMAAVAVVAVIVGLSLGMATSSVTSPTDSGYKVSCGSPWSPDASDAEFQDELTQAIGREQYGFNFNPGYADKCEQAHGARGGWGIALAGLGALTLVGLGLVAAAGGSAQRPTPTP